MKTIEIIIIHDGPLNKKLLEIENKFIDKLPLKIYNLDKNYGLTVALNYGIKFCSNEWIARMDTDDICDINRFKKQINYIKCHPEVDFLGGQIIEFDDCKNKIIGKRIVPISHQNIIKRAKSRNPMNHMTVMYKKSILRNIDYYKKAPYFEDYYLWLRAIKKGYIFANLDDILVYVRAGNKMINRRRGFKYFKSEYFIYRYMYKKKIISFCSFNANIFTRFILRMSPPLFLNYFYKVYLRQN